MDGPDFAEAFDAAWEDEFGQLPYLRYRREDGTTEVLLNPVYQGAYAATLREARALTLAAA